MTEFPAGPWVVVAGMHRSGTSAIAGVLAALGLHMPVPSDLMPGAGDNPHFFESLTAYEINEDLLERLGGAWDAPPDLPGAWEQDPAIRFAHDTEGLMANAYTKPGPSVWKDPRACILLPYWKLHLPPPVAAVLVWRRALPVARSLRKRDGIAVPDGIALWERYNRDAVEGLQGVDTLVVDYDSAVEEPRRLVDTVIGWLDSLDGFDAGESGWNVEEAQEVVSAGLRHQRHEETKDDDELLLPEHRALTDFLSGLEGPHRPLRTALPGPASRWASALVARRRAPAALERDLLRLARQVDEARQAVQVHADAVHSLEQLMDSYRDRLSEANRRLNRVLASTSWRITRPLRSGAAGLQRLRPRHGRSTAQPGRRGGDGGG